MTRDNNDIRAKGRAVFLAALMVVSMFAIGATFAGTAAANVADHGEFDYDPTNPWQGQDVTTDGLDADPNDEFELRRVTEVDENEVSRQQFVRDVIADDDGEVEIETDDLDADDYFISGQGLPRTGFNSDDVFEVRVQDFDAEWDDEEVTDDGADSVTELELSSNRARSSVNVSTDGDLDDEEYVDIFVTTENLDSDDGVITEDGDPLEGAHIDDIREAIIENRDLVTTEQGGDIVSIEDFESDDINVGADDDPVSMQDLVDTDANPFKVLIYDEDVENDHDADEMAVMYDLQISPDIDADVDFQGIDDDTYDFLFEVTDTAAEASATITVVEEDVEVIFDQDVYEQPGGDILEVTVEFEDTDDAYIQFGDENSGFVDILYVEDDGGEDGEATFRVNLRTIGTAVPEDDVVWSDDDIVESLIGQTVDDTSLAHEYSPELDEGGAVTFWDEDVDEDEFTFAEYLEELDLLDDDDDHPTEQIVRPIHGTDFDLAATGTPDFIADDGESELDEEDGLAVLDIPRPELGDTTIWVGPEEDADDEDDIDELVEQLTERENVAIDDLLVAQFEAQGLYGAMTFIAEDFEGIDDGFEGAVLAELRGDNVDDPRTIPNFPEEEVDWDGEGIEFVFEEIEALDHEDENELDLEQSEDEVFILVDNDAGEMYVIVDTSDEPFTRSIDDGDEFEVELAYETDGDDRFRFADAQEEEAPILAKEMPGEWQTWAEESAVIGGADGDVGDEAYPYFRADQEASTSASFTFVDQSVTFDNVIDNLVQIENTSDSVVSGETNVAPGTSASVRVRNRGDTESFLVTENVDIESDGSFEAEFDFEDRDIDDEATVLFRVAGSTLDSQNAVFVEQIVDVDPVNLTVNVEDEDGNAIENAAVTANDHSGTTDADGVAVLEVPPGDYTVSAVAGGYEEASEDISIEDDDELTLTLAEDDELAELREEIEELQVFIDTLEQERDALQQERDELEAERDELQQQVDQQQQQIDDLQAQIDELEEQPGFGLVVALIALLAAAGLAVRRRA